MNDEEARTRQRREASSDDGPSTKETGEGSRPGARKRAREPEPDHDPGIAASEVLRQIRAGLASADARLAAMTDSSVGRAEERASEAREAAQRDDAGREAQDLGRATYDEARAQAKEARDLGDLHREVVDLLGADLERLIDRLGSLQGGDSEAEPKRQSRE